MGQAIGAILGLAVGVALSPFPIVAVILMLFTPKAKVNSVLFLLGWIVGLTLVGTIVLLADVTAAAGGESTPTGWLKLALGLLLLFLGWRSWTHRPQGDDQPEMPKWMTTIDGFTAAKSFGLAAVLSGLNPKNLALTAAAAASIGAAGLSTGQEFATLAIFVVLASLTVALPVIFYLVKGDQADAMLTGWKTWLVANNATVMGVLLVVFGAKLLGDGIAILA
jgi:hypothetical protein